MLEERLYNAVGKGFNTRKDSGEEIDLDERRLLLKVSEAAELCGYSRSFLYERIQAGDIPVIRLGKTIRIPRVWLEKWIAQKLDAWERIR